MEGLILLLAREVPVDALADLLHEHDTRLWRVIIHYVNQAHAKSDWSQVRRELQRQGEPALKGAMWSLRGNAWNLSAEHQQLPFRRISSLPITEP